MKLSMLDIVTFSWFSSKLEEESLDKVNLVRFQKVNPYS